MVSTSAADPVLPWPECLGTFDEESCRYFLRELGQRMVQFYPFSVGIEEVYSQIIDEYGLEGTPDALSVLQELLEDDSAAAGSGDDGDIWRSWRHSWRHRNVSAFLPFDPSVPYLQSESGHYSRPVCSESPRSSPSSTNFGAHSTFEERQLRYSSDEPGQEFEPTSKLATSSVSGLSDVSKLLKSLTGLLGWLCVPSPSHSSKSRMGVV